MRNTQHRTLSKFRAVAVAVSAGFLVVACGSGEDGSDAGHKPVAKETSYTGTLAVPAKAEHAFSYDKKLAPVGAELAVKVEGAGDATTFALTVTGLQPERGYAAHAHTKPCGKTGDAAGPHFQHKKDPAASPEAPSADAKYANPENEFWLDLTTDKDGNGTSEAKVPFAIDGKAPKSVVVHAEEKTATADGKAGKAGDRIACLTVAGHH